MNFLRRFTATSETEASTRDDGAMTARDDMELNTSSHVVERVPMPCVLEASFDGTRDGDLVFLWTLARGAARGSAERGAVNAFFDAFGEMYANWVPLIGDITSVEDAGCRRAHPREVVERAVSDAASLADRLDGALSTSMDIKEREERRANVGIEAMRALEVMSRSAHNRVVMVQYGVFKALMSACKACLQRLLTIGASASGADGASGDEARAQLDAMQRVIAHAVSILGTYLKEDKSWALQELTESSAQLCLIDVLRIERAASAKFNGSMRDTASSIEDAATAAIGYAIDGDVAMQKSLAAAGALDIFFEGVYSRDSASDVDAKFIASSIAALDLVRRVMSGSKANIERAQAVGMFNRLSTLVRRVSSLCNGSVDEPSVSGDEIEGVPWDSERVRSVLLSEAPVPMDATLSELYSLLLKLVERDEGIQSPEGWASKGAKELLAQCVVDALTESCSSASLPFASARKCLELRSFVARFVSDVIARDPTMIPIVRKSRTWEVLLDCDTFGPIQSASEDDAEVKSDDGNARLRQRVQTQVVALLLKAGRVASEATDSISECNALVGAITTRAIQPSAVLRCCPALELFLKLSSHGASKALSEIEAPGRLAGALSAQLKCWGSDDISFCENHSQLALPTPHAAALGATLSALRSCLEGPDVLALSTLNNDGVVDLIFSELLWATSTRDFAIQAVISLIGQRINASSPDAGAHRDAWSTLARRYVQALPRARGVSFDLLQAMLRGLRNMLNNPNGSGSSLRDLLSSEGGGAEFVQIVALCDGDAGENVALEVISTMQAVISNSHAAAATFEKVIGYDTFMEAIQCARGVNTMSEALFGAFMSLIVDDTYDRENVASSNVALRNSGALRTLLQLFNTLEVIEELRILLFTSIKHLLSTSVTSKATANSAGALDFFLGWYTDAEAHRESLLEVIRLCSSFSMSTKQVRHIFQLLKSDEVSSRDHLKLIQLLQHSAKREGPSTFFDFTGPGCGIHVNKQLTLPVRNGYTICMWFRIEKFPEAGNPVSLFSLLVGNGNGILGELNTDKLTLGIRGAAGTTDTASLAATIEENKWTFLSLVHLPGRLSQPVVKLFMGSTLMDQAKLRYPVKSAESISYCRIASVTFDTSVQNPLLKVCPFFGQLGSTYILDDALSPPAISMIYALGPEYVGRFKSTESHTEKVLAAVSMNAIEGRETREYLAEHIVLVMNAVTLAGRATQYGETDGNQTDHDYSLIGGAKVCVTKSVKDVIHCLGGVQVILPILSNVMRDVDVDQHRAIVCEGVYLLVALLDGSRLNQVTLTACDGYALIANLLRSNGQKSLGPALITALDKLRRTGGLEHETSSARVVLDLRLWALADAETQQQHGEYILSLAMKHAEGLRYHLPMSTIIDALEYTPGEAGVKRRRVLLEVLKHLIVGAPTRLVEEAAESIIYLIEECADDEVVGDVLRFLVNLMQPGDVSQHTLNQAFTKYGGPLLALSSLSRDSQRVRSFALLWLANLMPPLEGFSRGSGTGAHISAAFGAAAGALSATLGGKFTATTSQDFEVGFFTAVANALEKFPLDVAECRSALFELLLGGQALPADKVAEKMNANRPPSIRAVAGRLFSKVTRQSDEAKHGGEDGGNVVGVPGIVNAGAAGVLLRLMSASDNHEMRLSVLELLLQLVEGASVNAQAVLEQRGWQTWILPILRDDGDETRIEERSIARRLITALLYHAVLRTVDGHHHVSNTLGVIDILIKRGALPDDSNLAQELLSDLLVLILPQRTNSGEQDEWSEVQNIEAPLCRRNLATLLHIFDSIISDTASQAAVLGVPNAPLDKTAIKQVSWDFYANIWALLNAISPPGQPFEDVKSDKEVKNTNMAQKIHRRAKGIIRDMPFSSTNESDVDTVGSLETLRDQCQRVGFRLILLYVRVGSLDDLRTAVNSCTGLLPSFLAPVLTDGDGKALDTSALGNRAHLFLADLLRFVETAKTNVAADDEESRIRLGLVVNLVRLASEVGRMLLSECETIEECAHLEGRDLISEQKVAAAAANEAKESRRVKEFRSTVSENFLAARTKHEQRQKEAESALLSTRTAKVTPVCDSERARRAIRRLTFEEHCDTLARRWSTILHDLQGERGPWSSHTGSGATYWKLDKSEDASMRRSRLKPDYKFQPYKDVPKGESATRADAQDSIQNVRLVGMGQQWKMTSDREFNDGDDEQSAITDELAEKLAIDKENEMHNSTKVLFSTPATLVTLTRTIVGKLDISRDAVVFVVDRSQESAKDHRKRFWRWSVEDIVEVHHMRYRLQHKAFEIHCSDHTSAFFAFSTKKIARFAAARVTAMANAVLMNRRAKAEAAERSKELWKRRELGTFDYLMALNTYAGRTLHDLSQYPVFPWVLKDYTSDTIDLNDPTVYRDLSRPVGALNPERLQTFIERYESLIDDPDTPPFHYGSHYSSCPIVLYYLLRLGPYTKLARALQGGRFDQSDRLFHSVAETFNAVLESSADVKELIPEFYYSSEFLVNTNSLELGQRQDGVTIGDVELPPWANGSRFEFTRVMRDALESEHVSRNLHSWIDLIFGCAQRGQPAVDRHNVFYYLTYEGAVDLDALEDADQRRAIETQIVNFGQTPTQIFRKAHPPRSIQSWQSHFVSESPETLMFAAVVSSGNDGKASLSRAVVNISVDASRVDTIDGARAVAGCRLIRPGGVAHNFNDGESNDVYALDLEPMAKRIEELYVSPDSLAHSQTVHVALRGKVLLSVGHWDRSMRLFDVDEGKEIQRISAHRDVMTCLSICEHSSARTWDASPNAQQMRKVVLVTGSRDTTIAIWELLLPHGAWNMSKAIRALKAEPRVICFGHDEPITCVNVSSQLNLIASGSADGTLVLHDTRDGHIVRAFERTPSGSVPSWIKILDTSSRVVCACAASGALSVHHVNGATLAKYASRHETFDACCVTRDERILLLGNRRGDVTLRHTRDLSIRAQINVANVGVTALSTAASDECLLVGLADGRLCLWAPSPAPAHT
mmetsp:Transcript_7408/g.24883  ORF Transcript_7408/g.24883 Transcript_7408/m.24883 type:complete len:2990 (-) Transcript_7408:33-9002(-)